MRANSYQSFLNSYTVFHCTLRCISTSLGVPSLGSLVYSFVSLFLNLKQRSRVIILIEIIYYKKIKFYNSFSFFFSFQIWEFSNDYEKRVKLPADIKLSFVSAFN